MAARAQRVADHARVLECEVLDHMGGARGHGWLLPIEKGPHGSADGYAARKPRLDITYCGGIPAPHAATVRYFAAAGTRVRASACAGARGMVTYSTAAHLPVQSR
ncbi:hypothetical protein D3C72_1589560 [compost metagenome]